MECPDISDDRVDICTSFYYYYYKTHVFPVVEKCQAVASYCSRSLEDVLGYLICSDLGRLVLPVTHYTQCA
jgi:ACT domain-containing protein